MGKGDARTKRGKIFRGSFGNSRPKHPSTEAKGPAATPKSAARPAPASRSRGKR